MPKIPDRLQCDICDEEAVCVVRSEKLCWHHALERCNAERAEAGRAPLAVGDDGNLHPTQ